MEANMSILIESCNEYMIENMNKSVPVLNLNEGIGDMLKTIWAKIKDFFQKIWNWIKEKVNKFIDLFKKNKKVKEKEVKELENKIKMTEQQAKSTPLMLEYNGTNEKIADVVPKENREVVAKEIKEIDFEKIYNEAFQEAFNNSGIKYVSYAHYAKDFDKYFNRLKDFNFYISSPSIDIDKILNIFFANNKIYDSDTKEEIYDATINKLKEYIREHENKINPYDSLKEVFTFFKNAKVIIPMSNHYYDDLLEYIDKNKKELESRISETEKKLNDFRTTILKYEDQNKITPEIANKVVSIYTTYIKDCTNCLSYIMSLINIPKFLNDTKEFFESVHKAYNKKINEIVVEYK